MKLHDVQNTINVFCWHQQRFNREAASSFGATIISQKLM